MNKIKLLDCTLRDGAYINGSNFGESVIAGLISKLEDANVDIIECGWLKNDEYKSGSSYFHCPDDIKRFLKNKKESIDYVAMIDYNRYNDEFLSKYDGKSIDAIRVVFPLGKVNEGIAISEKIRNKGYKVYLQAANTLAYSENNLKELVDVVNKFCPVALSVVDTFGAMYKEDLLKIVNYINARLDKKIKLGFHSHNNQQLSFALSMSFIEFLDNSDREIIIDSSLSGMGRGAGNTTTELIANYLNIKFNGNYNMNAVMDAIDMYMDDIHNHYSWGYSTPYFIAGMYQCHVNNIAYLLSHHRTSAHDMRNIIESLSVDDRRKYDYDLLESKYLEQQSNNIDDSENRKKITCLFKGKPVLLLAPGKSIESEFLKISEFIKNKNPIVIGVNSYNHNYTYDYLFFTNSNRYEYTKNIAGPDFEKVPKILLSNLVSVALDNDFVFNYNDVIKRGYAYFDNAVICILRLLNQLQVKKISIAGFDGFSSDLNNSYFEKEFPILKPIEDIQYMNHDISKMFHDFVSSVDDLIEINLLTESYYF